MDLEPLPLEPPPHWADHVAALDERDRHFLRASMSYADQIDAECEGSHCHRWNDGPPEAEVIRSERLN